MAQPPRVCSSIRICSTPQPISVLVHDDDSCLLREFSSDRALPDSEMEDGNKLPISS